MPTTTGPMPPSGLAPVAAPQAPPAASAPSSTDRSAASSLNLDGAPVRLEWWERLGGLLLQFRALRILMRVRMVLTWVSLLIVAVTLAVSPVARTVLGAWIGCFWIVAVCFWLARGKTVSWGLTSSVFALSMPWAGAVGWLSFQVAAAARVPVSQTASQVVIAGVVEELAKLAPICLVAVIAPGRVRRLLIQDWLVLGVACGAGFMAVEEVVRRLTYVLGNTPGLQLSKAVCPEDPEGIIECIHAHTFSLWPFSDAFPGPVTYAGHAIVTGLVAVSIGLARHLWWRARHHHPAFGVALRCTALGLPLGVLWVAIVDHMATNSRSFNISWTSDEPVIKAWGATKGEAPWPIVGTTSSMAGSGQGRGWLLLVMLVLALLLDARVMRLGGYARVLGGPGGGPGVPQGPPGGVAGRWGADVVEVAAAARAKAHRLRLALAQAATTRRPRLFLKAWAEHRIARDLAARRQLDAGPHRWATSALAAAAALAGAWIIYTVVPPVVTELNQRLNGLPTFWFAGILDMLAAVWESMSPTEKTALVLIGAAAVLLSGGTLGAAFSVGLGIATALDAARPASQLVRDPWGATGHYLDTHNDLEIAADAGLAAMAIIPGGKALRGAGYAAKTAQAAKPVKRFAHTQARRGLNPRAGIHYPGLRTPRPGRSDGGPGLWGEGKNYGSPRSQAYEEQITRVPIEHSYYVNGKEFDGYDGFALIDAKGPGYANPIKGTWSNEPKSTYRTDPVTGEVKRVKKGLIDTAKEQVEAVRATGADTPIQWHIAEKETFDELFNRQKFGKFPIEIELFYTPPN
ncbi:PrsW family glutamic-type intramembrane protease [Actinomyces oris]|uniref:PrsW family glutamic-type intramembrane protease n=1 Tax=Actinomyces oris TaxID=544580 RepID=UPI002115E438|nr:PrsW family glutamic-type intramembrane protease [Actinomyces oris]